MKVVCESCQAKYQVPDERVAGKKLKIRCKRCGATVLIRGDLVAGSTSHEQFSSPPESLAPIETSAQETVGFEWHVSLDGDTRGPFALDELRAWLSSTVGGWEAHVWHEGFPDWIDARACAELEPPPLPAEPVAAHGVRASMSMVGAGAGMGGLHSDELPTQTFQAPSSHQSAQFFAEMSGVAHAGGGQRQASSLRLRPASGYGEVAPVRATTNGRPDESVVFSQSSLQTMTGHAASAPAPSYTAGPNPGFASGEGSGLIDIRALASLARQSTTQIAPGGVPSPRAAVPRDTRDSDIRENRDMGALSFGTDDDNRGLGSSAFARVDSLAPVSTGHTSNAALPLAILGGCALVAAAVLAAVLFNRPSRPAEVVSGQGQMQESVAAAAQPPNSAEPVVPKRSERANATDDATRSQELSGDQPASPVAREDEAEDDSDELAAGKPKRQPRLPHTAVEEKKSGAAPEEKAKPKKEDKPEQLPDSSEVMLAERARPVKQAPPPAASAAPETPVVAIKDERAKASGTDIDALLAAKPAAKPAQKNASTEDLLNAASKAPAPAAPAPAVAAVEGANSDLPDSPSREETLAAMRGVEAAVRACASAEQITGTADVSISVAGPTGRVTSATVTGITGNVGSCIARAVRGARFPHFSKPLFSIKYPYRF